MRIISGTYKGRVLHPPKNLPTRPTTDFAKTGLFNILNNLVDYENTSVLDLCAGTGNISFEFASRGAKHITSVDSHAACLKFISDTARELKFTNFKTWKTDIFRFIDKTEEKFDLIFVDPPYEVSWIEQISEKVFEKNLLNDGGMLIVEHGNKTELSAQKYFSDKRNYGNVNFSIFIHRKEAKTPG
ncbi:MAG TPA: RsmD family RNA methyltransferase [Bacteroidia bacterium]|nr:RsmD family RNA methyltransferase [Bacteroidia bacterium]